MKQLILVMFIFLFAFSKPCSALENIDQMKKLADGGNAYAQYETGKWYYEHGNEEAGNFYLNWACNNKNPQACEYLTQNIVAKFNFNDRTPQEQFKLGDIYLKEKKYPLAFKLFKLSCEKGNYPPACLQLGRAYAVGEGTARNSEKAMEIFNKYYHEHDAFKLEKALMLEYAFGSNAKTIDEAMEIYNSIANSSTEWIVQDAKSGLGRIPAYIFVTKLFPALIDYSKDRIKYEQLESTLNSIDVGSISPALRDLFFKWKEPYLKVAKMNDSALLDGLLLIGSSAVKGFMGDWSFVLDAGKHLYSAYTSGETVDMVKHYQAKIFEQLQKEQISSTYVNSLFK